MIVSAFSKRLRKNPPPDEDILSALIWVERMISAVRGQSDIADLPTADEQDEPGTLPANWFERDGLTDDGSRFAYCDAEGSEQAHCVLAQRHGGAHQWAWFTREQRARVNAGQCEDELTRPETDALV